MIVLDSTSSVLAVACASPEDERAVMAGEAGSESVDLRLADAVVGRLRYRSRGEPDQALLRLVTNLIALEVERAKAPARASEAAVSDFFSDLLSRRVTDRDNIHARAEELGSDLREGASVLVARARPQGPVEGDWRSRVLLVAERGVRAIERRSLAALVPPGWSARGEPPTGGAGTRADPEVVIVVPGIQPEPAERAAAAVRARARRRPARIRDHRRAQPPDARRDRPAPRGRRGAAGGQRGRGPRPRPRSRSRRPGPTGCCCRR